MRTPTVVWTAAVLILAVEAWAGEARAEDAVNLAITVATILPDQLDDVGRQPSLVFSAVRDLALRRAMLPERRTGPALGNRQRISNMLDAGAAPRGAQ